MIFFISIMLVSLNQENDPSLTYTYMTPMSTAITIYHAKDGKAITCIQKTVLNHHSGVQWKLDTTIDVPREQ